MKSLITLLLLLSFPLAGFMRPAERAVLPVTAEALDAENAKLLTSWMDVQLSAIRQLKLPSHHFRQLCYTSIGFYESVVHGSSQYKSLAGQLNGLASLPQPDNEKNISWQASGNAAMAEMLRYFYPGNPVMVTRIDSMENACMAGFEKNGDTKSSIAEGSKYGKEIAHAIIDWCKTDLSDKENEPYNIPTGEGFWEPTPPGFQKPIRPFGGNSRTIVPRSIENTLPLPPTRFSSEQGSDFYKMVNEVYTTSQAAAKDKNDIAMCWDDSPDGSSLGAGGHWLCILKDVITAKNIPLIESAHIYSEMYIAMYDASIGCFKAKYMYNLMRPVTYIRKYIQADWSPLIVTPVHPEYPAAHATISTAAATVLDKLVGGDVEFTDKAYKYKGYADRSFRSFKDAGREAGMSRLYGGIHYRPSIEAGYMQGEKIAENVLAALEYQ